MFYNIIHAQEVSKTDYTKYVDPFIGTQGGGNIFPGASYPFGLVKVGPDCGKLNSNMGYINLGKVRGFSQVHLSGSGGGPKYGDILLYPFMGEVKISDYGSDRGKETAGVGYFSVELSESDILAELTSTFKTGMHRYTFSKPGNCGILIDAGSFLGKQSCCFENQVLVGSEIEIISNNEIAGYHRLRGGWNDGGPFSVYFYALFDTPAQTFGTWKSGIKHEGNRSEFDSGEPVGAWFGFTNNAKKTIEVRVGISFISIGKAKENCLNESSGLSFEQAVLNTKSAWNNYLQRVAVESDNEIEKIKFYTAIYHSLMQPIDRTGENPKWFDNAPYFDDFYCIWDTYRTTHPLIGLIAPEKQTQIVNAMIDIFEHEGYMPEGRSGNYNGRTQGGSNCDMVVGEAILKNFKDVDYEKAWQAMIKNAEIAPGGNERKEGRGGLADYNTKGYVSTDFERAGSRTVEYAANDWAIAQCALKLGKKDEYEKYYKRAANWENLWKPVESEGAKGFIMPRKENGEWDENYYEPTWQYYSETPPNKVGLIPFNSLPEKYLSKEKFTVFTAGSWVNFFYESQSWEYSLYVPHDVRQLINKCGGKDAFISRLDTFFEKNYFNIANEPGFLTPCLYIYAGRPDKTAQIVNKILNKYFSEKPDGIPGNDDSGAMSSWLAFHNMGFFPNAGQDVYLISTPRFKKVTVSLGDGKKLIVSAENLSDKNIYIVSAELNGKALNQAWFRHSDIINGGTLKFKMSDKSSDWGTVNLPPSRSDN
jgi:predicted alpha-1,2-mannosidase